jgi:hypothetical protein
MAQTGYGTRTDQEIIGKIHLIDDGTGNYGTLAVDGTSTLTGAVTAASTLAVTGALTASSGITSTGGQGVLGTQAFKYLLNEPTSVLAATIDGRGNASAVSATLTSGTVYAVQMPIESGVTAHNITLFSLTAEATGTHAWVGIADKNRNVLAVSVDKTAAAYFAANTAITTAVTIDGTNPWVNATTDMYYIFVCVVASGTMPTFAAAPALAHANISAVAPIYCGSSDTGKTTPYAVAAQMGTLTATAGHNFYAYIT